MSIPTCPNRNYCDPTQSGCGTGVNQGLTWFYTDQHGACDAADPCFGLSSDDAQNYCNNNASNNDGGTFTTACIENGDTCLFGLTNTTFYSCIKQSWDPSNQVGCCTGSFDDPGHCDPTWCPSNYNTSACSGALATYCAQEANVATQACIPFCQEPANKSICDGPMTTYCQNNIGSQLPICACINAGQENIPRPACFDAACTAGGAYETAQDLNDVQSGCGTFCGEFISCVNTGICNVTSNTFINICGNITPTPTPTPSGGNIFSRIPTWVYLVIGLVVFGLIILLGGYVLYRRSHRPRQSRL